MGVSESFVYESLRKRFVFWTKLKRLLQATGTGLDEVDIAEVMLRHGHPLTLPKEFDADLMYLLGVVFGDGDLFLSPDHGTIRVSNSDEDLLRALKDILWRKFRLRGKISRQKDRVPSLRVHSKTVARLFHNLGMRTPKRDLLLHPRLTAGRFASRFLRGLMDADGCVVVRKNGSDSVQFSTISERLGRQVQLMLETYGVKARLRVRDRRGVRRLKNGHAIRMRSIQYHLVITGNHIDAYAENIGFSLRTKRAALERATGGPRNTNKDVLPLKKLLIQSDATPSAHWVYLRGKRNPSRGKAHQILQEVELEAPIRGKAARIVEAQLAWEEVWEVQDTGEKEVYDLTVPDTHNFVGNGLLVHNTAAAVRDEFGEGRWTLEAGALVLADRGMAMIDEIEKMSEQDRSSIHTAMEQQTVHVAKAGITATLQTRCAILAAANPTLGRFDENRYISEQITLPATLLSRFDIIFPVMDRPQAQLDRAMAEHILRGHLAGEQLRRGGDTPSPGAGVDEAFLPYFDPSFLRKYVAYAKRIYPVMTPEAMQIIQEKYLDIRKQGEVDGGAVPITPRQLEAFIRLAEASARARLSAEVTDEDANRAVRIVEYWLQKVTGIEGGFDIDIVATGVSSSQRAQMTALRDIIAELAERDGVADLRDILEMAEERGIPGSRVEAWLRRWSQEGEVYSPAANKWRLVSRS